MCLESESNLLIFEFSLSLSDSHHALELLERIQDKLHQADAGEGSNGVEEDLSSLIYLLDSPLFNQLLAIQDALHQLKQASPLSPGFPSVIFLMLLFLWIPGAEQPVIDP